MTPENRETILQPAFFRPEQVAAYLSLSRRYVSELTRRGVLPVARLGRKCSLYAKADLDHFVESLKVGKGVSKR